jgi:hypothetical protein
VSSAFSPKQRQYLIKVLAVLNAALNELGPAGIANCTKTSPVAPPWIGPGAAHPQWFAPPIYLLKLAPGNNWFAGEKQAGTAVSGKNYVNWDSGADKCFNQRDSSGTFAIHGSYRRVSPNLSTSIYTAFWAQTSGGIGTTLLHESYHHWGYHADVSGYDYAEAWGGEYMTCLLNTKAWSGFRDDPEWQAKLTAIKKEVGLGL